jgi:hypothetical protein
MYWDVISVKPESDLSLNVSFKDGTSGKVFFEETHLTGVFSLLTDSAFFSSCIS